MFDEAAKPVLDEAGKEPSNTKPVSPFFSEPPPQQRTHEPAIVEDITTKLRSVQAQITEVIDGSEDSEEIPLIEERRENINVRNLQRSTDKYGTWFAESNPQQRESMIFGPVPQQAELLTNYGTEVLPPDLFLILNTWSTCSSTSGPLTGLHVKDHHEGQLVALIEYQKHPLSQRRKLTAFTMLIDYYKV
jgi:hypothetical protein